MAWKKIHIQKEDGTWADAQAPEIVSASRSTDIPAFYCEWFFNRLRAGYSAWTNPFNNVKSYVAYHNTRFIVFWSKNPRPLLQYLDFLDEPVIAGETKEKINCYVQYTLNDYEKEKLETVPPLQVRIETFKLLVERLGKGHVVWRFDPMLLTDRITMETLLERVENIGDQLKGYTEKLVFSFADIALYKKVKKNLIDNHINYEEWTEEKMAVFASRLADLNDRKGWNFELATCGEKEIFRQYGIKKNSCVDDTLMIRLAYDDVALMNFLGVEVHQIGAPQQADLFSAPQPLSVPSDAILLPGKRYALKKKDNRDKGQRELCGCMISKDIGEYNTCPHQCEYCYANTSKQIALDNYKKAREAGFKSETITGK